MRPIHHTVSTLGIVRSGRGADTDLEYENWQRAVDVRDKGWPAHVTSGRPSSAGRIPRGGVLVSGGMLKEVGSLLDVACGPGRVPTPRWPGRQWRRHTALDFSPNFLRLAQAPNTQTRRTG